jgi:hypothetical protein
VAGKSAAKSTSVTAAAEASSVAAAAPVTPATALRNCGWRNHHQGRQGQHSGNRD